MTEAVPDAILAPILADAARRAGVSEDDIDLIVGEPVTWTDGSLGCPEPGMMYTQALVDGFHVVVEAGGEELDYRVDRTGGFRLCENPSLEGGGQLPSE